MKEYDERLLQPMRFFISLLFVFPVYKFKKLIKQLIGVFCWTIVFVMPVYSASTAPGSLIGYDSTKHGRSHVRCVLAPIKSSFSNMRPGNPSDYYKMNMVADNSPGGSGHIQGVARLYVGSKHNYFALSRGTSNDTYFYPWAPGGGVHVGKYSGNIASNDKWTSGSSGWPNSDSTRIFEYPSGDVVYNENTNCRHPGGLSAIGDFLVTGWDRNGCPRSSIEIYNVSKPGNISRTKKIDNTIGSANVAITRLNDPVLGNKFLLAAGGSNMKTVEFFLCDDLDGGHCESIYLWEEKHSYTHHGDCWNWWSGDEWLANEYFSGIQFATECGSGQVYMVGTNKKGDNVAHMYKVTYSASRFHFEKICASESFPTKHGINFDGGASIYIDPAGRMQMYGSGKCQGGGCSWWNDTVIGQFWNTTSICLTNNATWNANWKNSTSLNIDNDILGQDIAKYKIKWFNGSWSGWYIPGQGDIDWNTNPNGQERRVWSYFYDHTHQYCF